MPPIGKKRKFNPKQQPNVSGKRKRTCQCVCYGSVRVVFTKHVYTNIWYVLVLTFSLGTLPTEKVCAFIELLYGRVPFSLE